MLARWLPVVRTFAPFVAGISGMSVGRFQIYNVSGALFWVVTLVAAGYFFGNIPIIRNHLNTIVLIGVAAAVVPVVLAAALRFIKNMGQQSKDPQY